MRLNQLRKAFHCNCGASMPIGFILVSRPASKKDFVFTWIKNIIRTKPWTYNGMEINTVVSSDCVTVYRSNTVQPTSKTLATERNWSRKTLYVLLLEKDIILLTSKYTTLCIYHMLLSTDKCDSTLGLNDRLVPTITIKMIKSARKYIKISFIALAFVYNVSYVFIAAWKQVEREAVRGLDGLNLFQICKTARSRFITHIPHVLHSRVVYLSRFTAIGVRNDWNSVKMTVKIIIPLN